MLSGKHRRVAMPTTGLFRVKGKSGLPNEVKVDAAGNEVFESEADYISRQRKPPLKDLPWEEEYLEKKQAALLPVQQTVPGGDK